MGSVTGQVWEKDTALPKVETVVLIFCVFLICLLNNMVILSGRNGITEKLENEENLQTTGGK